MKNLILVFVLSLGFVTSVFADGMSGNWTGNGEVEMFIEGNSQGTAECKTFEFNISETVTDGSGQIILNSGYFWCGATLDERFDAHVLDVRKGLVFENDVEVGTLNGNHLVLVFKNESVINNFDILLDDTKTSANYGHTWTDGYTKLIMKGFLKKS